MIVLSEMMERANKEQNEFIDIATRGHNVVLLGKAGTGKTFAMSRAISILKARGNEVMVTSSSGMAATLFKDGRTLHSAVGIGTCRLSKDSLLSIIDARKDKLAEIMRADVLVIDEASAISANVIEVVEFILRGAMQNSEPFGGKQILLSADFFQLPPVKSNSDDGRFIYECKFWKSVFPHIILLSETMRQSEKDFINFLNHVAEGKCTCDDVKYAREHLQAELDDAEVTKIVCTNEQIYYETLLQYERINEELLCFDADDDGDTKILKKCIADKRLLLKVGAPVMLLYNINKDLVNGLQGTFLKMEDGCPVVNFTKIDQVVRIERKMWSFFDENNGKMIASRKQFPLKPSFAITAHKSQGQTLKAVEVISGNEFIHGQLYVACSRVRRKEDLCLKGFDISRIIPPPASVTEFYDLQVRTFTSLQQDFSCCRNNAEFKSVTLTEALSLEDVEWNDQNFEMLDDISETEVEENSSEIESQSEEMNKSFDTILKNIDMDRISLKFPHQFEVNTFIKVITRENKLNPDLFTENCLATEEASLLETLEKNEHDLLQFLRIQWHRLALLLKQKDEKGIIKQQGLTSFCAGLFALTTDEHLLEEFSMLTGVERGEMSTEHFSVCTDFIFGIALVMLQSLTSGGESVHESAFKSFENLTSGEMGKIRYVGGWALKKLLDAARRYVTVNVTSENKDVRKHLKNNIVKSQLLQCMLCSESVLRETSNYKGSLDVTSGKQFRTHGLLNISDEAYEFFLKLEEQRVSLLTQNRLNSLKGEIICDSVDATEKNKTLFELWREICSNHKKKLIDIHGYSDEIVDECIKSMYYEIVHRYFNMGAKEFLRSYRREKTWQKSQAHRIKIQIRTQKNDLKSDQVNMEDIRSDQSDGKIDSHNLLKAMIQKQPAIFLTRLYSNKDIELLLKAYGINKKGKKEIIGNRLVQAIQENISMVDSSVFE